MSSIKYCLLFGTGTSLLDMIKSGATEGTKVFQSQCFPFEYCMSLRLCGAHYVVGPVGISSIQTIILGLRLGFM